QDDLISIACYIFLHDDRIRASRRRSPSENPNRFTARNAELRVDTRCLFASDSQSFALSARACQDRVAIHCGVVEVWQRQPRKIILGCKATERPQKRNSPRGQRLNGFENFAARFFLADHQQSFQLAISNWQWTFLRDILAADFGEVAEWLKAALC